MKRALTIFLYPLWLLIAIVTLLFVVEFASRWLKPEWVPPQPERSIWGYDARLGWRLKPNISERVSHPHFDIEVTTNSHALRDKEYSIERTAKKRMMVLGDSFAWGFGVNAEDRFSEVLEQRHPEWEIINAGASGYGTDQEYLYYVEEGSKFAPDVVLLLFYYNDFQNNYSDEQYYYPKPFFTLEDEKLVLHNQPVPSSSLSLRLTRYIETETYFLTRIWRMARMLYFYIADILGKPYEGGTFGFAHFYQSMPVTHALLRQLKHQVESNNATFVMFGLPIRPGLKKSMEKLTEQGNWHYLNLDPFFAGTEDRTEIPGDEHWNEEGHLLAADVMENYLREIGVFHNP